jgi:hypothetical protein
LVIEIADQNDAQQLKKYCLYFFVNEFDAVSKTDAYKNLSPQTLAELNKFKKPVQSQNQSTYYSFEKLI